MTTEQSTALVPYRVQPPAMLLPTMDEMQMIKQIAATAGAAGSLLPQIGNHAMTAAEAAVIMLYGRELGVQPMASLAQIYVVKGRPQPSAQLYLGLMQARDATAGCEILERTEKRARVRLTYRGKSQVFEATIEDAEAAGLTKGREGQPTINWKLYPKQMLTWTAVRTGARIMAADALSALAGLPPQATMEDYMLPDDGAVAVTVEEPSEEAPPAGGADKVVEGSIARPDQPPAGVEEQAPEAEAGSEGDETPSLDGPGETSPLASDDDSRDTQVIIQNVRRMLDEWPSGRLGLRALMESFPEGLDGGVFKTKLLSRVAALRLEAALLEAK